MKLFNWLRDPTYDNRKVVNSEAVLQCAQQMGITQAEVATLCDISKTMVSHWGNPNRSERPTLKQIEPMLEKYGRDRFKVQLEPLSAAAREHTKLLQWISTGTLLGLVLFGLSWVVIRPCVEKWQECQKLPWYEMPVYFMIENNRRIEEYKHFHSKSSDQAAPSSEP